MASKAPSVEVPGALNVKNLSSELSTVSKWYQLGIKLGLQPSQLRQIEQEVPTDIDRRKIEVVDIWLQSTPGASWRHIVTALRELGDVTTAERIELKYVKTARADSHQEELGRVAAFAFENRQAINDKFADFLTNVCTKMLKSGVDIETFRLFITALFPPGDCIPPLPTNVTKVFEAITHHGLWDSLNYSPLVRIVRKFGAGDPEMKAWIEKYKKDLKAYTIVASIEDCIDTCTDDSRLDSAKYDSRYNCPVEWKTEFVDHSLQHLIDVWEMFSVRYLGPDSPPTALLDRVRTGCLSVTWLVPSHLIPQLVKTAKVDITFFKKHRILKLMVGGELVYEEEVAKETTEEPQLAHQKEATVSKVRMGHEGGAEVGQHHEKSATSAQETFGGYDYDFIELPPSIFQTECPICHLILREPYQVTCCGTSFCHTCIQRLQTDETHCPACREDKFEVFPNKGLNRSLKQLQVYCTRRKDGCQWRGELGELNQHLNVHKRPLTTSSITMTNFEERKRSGEDWYSPPFYTHPLGYKMSLCVTAGGFGKGVGTHVSVFAHLMQGEFDDYLTWPLQGQVVIQLCNQLQDKYHFTRTIDFIESTNADAISRVTTRERAKYGMGYSTFISHNDLHFNSTPNCQYLKNNRLHFQFVALQLPLGSEVLPTEVTMTSFAEHKTDSDAWLSSPFYTHPQGYNMRLRVFANGESVGMGKCISVYAILVPGKYDGYLKWPFRGHLTVAMLNQLNDNNHVTFTIAFTGTTENYTYIAHTELNFNPTKNCQYLKYDCLRFRIVKVELE